jgi:hypothetical protein
LGGYRGGGPPGKWDLAAIAVCNDFEMGCDFLQGSEGAFSKTTGDAGWHIARLNPVKRVSARQFNQEISMTVSMFQ